MPFELFAKIVFTMLLPIRSTIWALLAAAWHCAVTVVELIMLCIQLLIAGSPAQTQPIHSTNSKQQFQDRLRGTLVCYWLSYCWRSYSQLVRRMAMLVALAPHR